MVALHQEEMFINTVTIVNIMEGTVAVDGLITIIIDIEGATMDQVGIQNLIGQVLELYKFKILLVLLRYPMIYPSKLYKNANNIIILLVLF